MRAKAQCGVDLSVCLNPCCNGIYSMRVVENKVSVKDIVLILVVMEYTQWEILQLFKK